MKTISLFAVAFLSLVQIQSVYACPQVENERGEDGEEIELISDDQIDQFLEEVSYLDMRAEKNQRIEACFGKHLKILKWNQALKYTHALREWVFQHSDYYNRSSTNERMIRAYWDAHKGTISAEHALEILRELDYSYLINSSIEEYVGLHLDTLSLEDFRVLVSGLREWAYYASDEHNRTPTLDRIATKFFKAKIEDLEVSEAIQVAKFQSLYAFRNMQIETYFYAHAESLSWDEVKVLIGALKEWVFHAEDKNNRGPTKDRIIRHWNECK